MKIRTLFLFLVLLLCQSGFAKQIVLSEKIIEYLEFESSTVPLHDTFVGLSAGYSNKKSEAIDKIEPAFLVVWYEEYSFTVDGVRIEYSNI